MGTYKIALPLLAFGAVLLAACVPPTPHRSASTTVTQDHSYKGGPFQALLVIGVLKDQALRRHFEDSVRQRLIDAGVDAVASHTVFPTADELTKEKVQLYVAEAAIDAVLVTRILGMGTETFEPAEETGPAPELNSWSEFSGQNLWSDPSPYYQPTGSTGSAVTEDVVSTEIGLFEVEDGARVWNADRTSTVTGDQGQTISEIGKMIVAELQAGQLI